MGHNGMLNIKPNMSKCSAYNASIVVFSFIYVCKIFFALDPHSRPVATIPNFSLSTKSHLREIQVLFINSGSFFKLFAFKFILSYWKTNNNIDNITAV